MSKAQVAMLFAAFQSVKVTDVADKKGQKYARAGQVGVVVGPGDLPGETAVKFEGATAADQQVIDTFPNDALQGL